MVSGATLPGLLLEVASLAVEHWLWGTRPQSSLACGPWSMGLVAVAHRLCCPSAYGTFPNQGLNLCPYIGRWILNHWACREVLLICYFLAGPGLHCGAWALNCKAQASLVSVWRSLTCVVGFAAPWPKGSEFPHQGLNPCPLHWKADSQPLDHWGSPCTMILYTKILIIVLFINIYK